MNKNILYVLLFLLYSGTSFGQVTDMGGPINWSNKQHPFTIPVHKHFAMKGINLAKLQAEDKINDVAKDAPWRFGYKHDTDIRLEDCIDGWEELENGDRVWRTGIVSANALSINLILEDLFIPTGAYIYLYDYKQTNRVGAYTSRNNREDGLLSTELVIGDHIIVEYYEPKEVIGQGQFTIGNVVHGYRSIGIIQDELEKSINDSGDCNFDVNCPLGNGWEDQKRSVAMIVVNGNGICTGALVNNTCEDGRPLILSANHCLSGGAATWSFRFNWASPPGTESCATVDPSTDPGAPYDQTANGATVLANGTEADYLLLEVDNMTVADAMAWNLYYAGWNHDDNANITQATCIHHPAGDVMKISREDDSPFHSTASSAEVWWIGSWELGTTQGGSSGSPLFDQDGRIVGQLYGGQAGCVGTNNNGSFDYFGRLGVSWNYGISDHLAPLSCGQALILDGWDPNAPSEMDDASAQSVSSPIGTICGDSFTPEVAIRNAGDNDLTSCTLTYNIDGGTNMVYNWTGLLGPNDSESITLPGLTSTNGAHTFNAFTSDPNATTDSNSSNDTIIVSFTIAENTIATFINITTDCYGYENAWELHDAGATLIASGGNTTVPPGGNQTATASNPGAYGNIATIQEKLCLAIGCYDFTMYDDWGDGLEGSTQGGCSNDGTYSITNSSSSILGSMQDVGFGVSETVNFCVVDDAGIDVFGIDDFLLFPNPSDGLINISLTNSKQNNFKLKVRDLSGRVIYESNLIENFSTIDLRNVANGSYFFSIENGNSILTKKVVVNN